MKILDANIYFNTTGYKCEREEPNQNGCVEKNVRKSSIQKYPNLYTEREYYFFDPVKFGEIFGNQNCQPDKKRVRV